MNQPTAYHKKIATFLILLLLFLIIITIVTTSHERENAHVNERYRVVRRKSSPERQCEYYRITGNPDLPKCDPIIPIVDSIFLHGLLHYLAWIRKCIRFTLNAFLGNVVTWKEEQRSVNEHIDYNLFPQIFQTVYVYVMMSDITNTNKIPERRTLLCYEFFP